MFNHCALAVCLVICLGPVVVHAQPPSTQVTEPDPDTRLDLLQPEFHVVALPTTLRLPDGKWGFRVTHRFTRALDEGSFGEQIENLFGLDSGALISLEVRHGVRPGTQVGIHRNSGRTIQFFGQQNVFSERLGSRFGLDALVTLEGENNLRERRQGALGAVVSRSIGSRGSVHAAPVWIANTDPAPDRTSGTLLVGLGTRILVARVVYVSVEAAPRLAGFRPGSSQVSAAIERRAGGHLFQLSVSNGFGTTLGHLARGTEDRDGWFLGFGIARKFFR